MMNATIAQRQYYSRPDDERFSSLADLAAYAETDRLACGRKTKRGADLAVIADGSRLMLQAGQRPADFTPWSFSQTASVIGAPARYLAGLPAPLAAECMNHGIKMLNDEQRREEHSILIRTYPDSPRLTVRAINSTKYAQVWDAPIIRAIEAFTGNGQINGAGRQWQIPPTWGGKANPGGLYRSDRDMFVYLIDGGSVVTDPTARSAFNTPGADPAGGNLYRGLIAINSEVGARTLRLIKFLFRWTCGNHMIGGLTASREYARRHIGHGHDYLAADALRAIAQWIDTPASRDESLIANLAQTEIAATKEDVIAATRGRHGLTESQATQAYDLAEKFEQNPRSVWGMAQGITRLSQQTDTIQNDTRFDLDVLAGQMLRTYTRKMVAA